MLNFILKKKEFDTEALGEETLPAISVLKSSTDDCVNVEVIERVINITIVMRYYQIISKSF